jgi:SAM-dependent methyltransferase
VTVHRRRPSRLLRGRGIEIGALHRRLEVPRGASVTYVDRLSVEELRRIYPELGEEDLTQVDVIGSAEDLSAFPDRSLDFVIANHLVEHLEDPIKAFKEFHRVLKPRGLVFMCVPDARVTFDRDRPLTTTEHLLAEHRGGPAAVAANRRGHFEEWVDDVENRGRLPDSEIKGDPEADREERVRFLLEISYSIHIHCWRSDTFIDFFKAACRAEGLSFEILEAIDTVPLGLDELILLIGKQPSLAQKLRARPLKETVRASPAGPLATKVYRAVRRRPR